MLTIHSAETWMLTESLTSQNTFAKYLLLQGRTLLSSRPLFAGFGEGGNGLKLSDPVWGWVAIKTSNINPVFRGMVRSAMADRADNQRKAQ